MSHFYRLITVIVTKMNSSFVPGKGIKDWFIYQLGINALTCQTTEYFVLKWWIDLPIGNECVKIFNTTTVLVPQMDWSFKWKVI